MLLPNDPSDEVIELQAGPWQDRAWDALQTGLTVWGAYTLFVALMRRWRR
jgi:hypothetical protein